MSAPKWRLRARRTGGFDLRLPAQERTLLAGLAHQLQEPLRDETGENSLSEPIKRLFPLAYPTDETAQATFASAVQTELAASYLDALDVLLRTIDQTRLTEQDAERWLQAINELRLVLGTSLGVSEEMQEIDEDDPLYSEWICYSYLSFLQGELVEAMSGLLPPPSEDDPDLPDDPWGEPPGGLRWDGTPIPPTAS